MGSVNIKESNQHFLLEITPMQDTSPECLREWIKANHELVQDKIALHGGLLFKGFAVKTAADFENIALSIDANLTDKHIFDGGVGTKRTKFVSDVANPEIKKILTPLSLHNEDSFVAETPTKIMFCSLNSAPWGGESLIADCRKVYQSLSQKIQNKYRNQKLTSTLVLEDRLFLANSQIPKNVQYITEFAKDNGAETVKRVSDNMTEFSFTIPAVITSKTSEEAIWFNTLHQAVFYNNCIDIWMAYKLLGGFSNRIKSLFLIFSSLLQDFVTYIKSGRNPLEMHDCKLVNGLKITAWDRIEMGLAFWENTAILPLKDGDFFVLDNRLTAHGRMPYKGKRVMVSAMTKPKATKYEHRTA